MDPQTRHRRTFSLQETHVGHSSSTSIDTSRESSRNPVIRHRLPPAASRRYYESTSRSHSKGSATSTTSHSSPPPPRYSRRSRSPRRDERLSKYDQLSRSRSPNGNNKRHHPRSRSRDRYSRRSRSRVRKPLTIDPPHKAPTADPTRSIPSASQPSSPTKQKIPTRRPESNQFTIPPGFRRQSLPLPQKPATASKFADLNALAQAISATVSASQINPNNLHSIRNPPTANVAHTKSLPKHVPDNSKAFLQDQNFDKKPTEVATDDSSMEIDEVVHTSKPAAHIDHDIKCDEPTSPVLSHHSPEKPPMVTTSATSSQDGEGGPQGVLWDRLRDFSQANGTWIRLRAENSRLQARSAGTEGIKLEDLQKYGESAYRRCERLIACIVDEVVQKVTERIQAAEAFNCKRCDQLEKRIQVLERQEKMDEEALLARLERNLDAKMERMVEERLAATKRLSGGGDYLTTHSTSHNDVPPANKKRKRSPVSPSITAVATATAINDANEARLAKLESTLTKWDLRLHEALGWEYRVEADPMSLPPEDVPQSLKQRIEKLEGDSQQVFGYLSAHHHALSTLDATLSLDPSKPLGQGLHRHLSTLRAEMAQMLTDAFGSLEDSIARMVVGVVIKQTKAEMEASYHRISKEIQDKFASSAQQQQQQMRPRVPPHTVTTAATVPSNGRPIHRTSSVQMNSGGILPVIMPLPSMKQ